MKIERSINEPIREGLTWEEKWQGPDHGLIICWEVGRARSSVELDLAIQAQKGQLIPLPWKGGVEKELKLKQKYGTYLYLAAWQGLRGEDLRIDTEIEQAITCTATNMRMRFTKDAKKYGGP